MTRQPWIGALVGGVLFAAAVRGAVRTPTNGVRGPTATAQLFIVGGDRLQAAKVILDDTMLGRLHGAYDGSLICARLERVRVPSVFSIPIRADGPHHLLVVDSARVLAARRFELNAADLRRNPCYVLELRTARSTLSERLP